MEDLKPYDTPWQLPFMDWAFNLPEDDLHRKFEHIQSGIDVLITHSPPYGILDSVHKDEHLGRIVLLRLTAQSALLLFKRDAEGGRRRGS